MSQFSNSSWLPSQSQNFWAILYSRNQIKNPTYSLSQDKYGFGSSSWKMKYDVHPEEFLTFNREEFNEDFEKYFDRLQKYHFTIMLLDDNDNNNSSRYNPAVICNLTSTPIYILRNASIIKIPAQDKRILLNNDYVSLSAQAPGRLFKFTYTLNMDIDFENCRIPRSYFIGGKIGSGGNAIVYKIWKCRMENGIFEEAALKVIDKGQEKLNAEERVKSNEYLMREVEAMNQLNNPHVIKLIEHSDTPKNLFLVMPFMAGGNLIGRITTYYSNTFMDENTAKFFFRQLLCGVSYMHKRGWTHRDIKPDNILLSDKGKWPILVISDLGLCKILTAKNTICGTLEYTAPEIIERKSGYDNKVDLWSCGVLLYTMLTGCVPFSDANACQNKGKNAAQQIMAGKISMNHRAFTNVSQSGKMLLSSLLQKNIANRWDASLASAHKWVDDRQTKKLLEEAYAAHNIVFPDNENELSTSLENVHLNDQPPEKRQRT